jgi:hypothetical protein
MRSLAGCLQARRSARSPYPRKPRLWASRSGVAPPHECGSPSTGLWPQPARVSRTTRPWTQDSSARTALVIDATSTSAPPSAPSSRAEAHRSSSVGVAGSAAPPSGSRDGPVRPPIAADLDGRAFVHAPTPDSDAGTAAGVMMRGAAAETNRGSQATPKRRAVHIDSNGGAFVDRTRHRCRRRAQERCRHRPARKG